MAQSKKPKPISDVTKPNSKAAEANSKSVIVTNRAILQDPMVKGEAEAEPASSDPLTVSEAKTLSAPELPTSKEKTIKPDKEDVAPEKESDSKKPVAAKEKPKEKPEAAPEDKPAEAAEQKTDAEDAPNDQAETEDEKAKAEKTAKQIDEEEARKRAAHEAAVDKIVESKKYFLPINTVEKRRSSRNVSLGVLLSLVLIIAWVDVAADAGIISLSSSLPHTHFFSQTSSTAATTSSAPATPAFKSYSFTVSKLKIRYPASWSIDSTKSTASQDIVFILPPSASAGANMSLGAISLNYRSQAAPAADQSYLIKSVAYKQLPVKNTPALYLRDIVFVDSNTGEVNVSSCLVNDQSVKVGSTIKTLTPGFSINGLTNNSFALTVTKTGGFKNETLAANYIKTSAYAQAKSALNSLTY